MMLRFIRFNSISTTKPRILSGELPITKGLIEKAIQNNELSDLKEILQQNKSLLSPPVKNTLADFISNDFSFYYLLKDHQWSIDQLKSLISVNPGRVDSSWDLYTRHGSPVEDDLIHHLIKSLIEYEDWPKVLMLYKKLGDKKVVGDEIFEKLMEKPELLPFFELDKEYLGSRIKELDGLAFLSVFQQIYKEVDFEVLAKGLGATMKSKIEQPSQFIEDYKRLTGETISSESPDIVEHIETNKLDLDDQPESLLVRMKLMELYAMENNDFETALKKYHQYQTHTDFGMELIQNILIQAYCLKAFNESKPELLPIVEALMLENIPIKIIQSLILTHAQFDADKSLEIYNKYIQQVSTKPNESQRSSAGLLNESIMLAYLYNNDRDFATIIYDKVQNSGLLNEHEMSCLKRLFKVYGDAYIEDDWVKAKPILHQHIYSTMRNL